LVRIGFYGNFKPNKPQNQGRGAFKGRFLKIGCSADKEDKVGKWTRKKQYNIRFLAVQVKKKAYFLIEQSSKSSKFPKSCQHQNVKYLPLKGGAGLRLAWVLAFLFIIHLIATSGYAHKICFNLIFL